MTNDSWEHTATTAEWLRGKEVVFTGRLASMTPAEARRLLAACGARYSHALTPDSALLIVGRQGWPLTRSGKLSPKLRQARALVRQGQDLLIISEDELLERLQAEVPGPTRRHYTSVELAELLGVSLEQLRSWVRSGLVQPLELLAGIPVFDYGQVAGAKTLCDLKRKGVSFARLRRSLAQLQRWLGGSLQPLTQLATLERSGDLLVRTGSGQLAEPNGQLRFDFAEVPPFASLPLISQPQTAEGWIEKAHRAEETGDLTQAVAAYREALLLGGPTPDACFSMANALYGLNQKAAAGERFRQVLELDPTFYEAWNNLGTVLAEFGELDEALAAYRRAIELNSRCADAHYNLADTLDALGLEQEACEHWKIYLRLDPQGLWADHARNRLRARSD